MSYSIVNAPFTYSVPVDPNSTYIYTDPIGRQTIIDISSSPSYTVSPVSPIYTPIYTLDTSYVYNLPSIVSANYEYQDINADPELHQKIMKKIYTNFYNFIIPNQFPHLLNYVTNSKGNYKMVKTYKEYKKNKTRENEYEPKLQYLARSVYAKTDMYKDIKNFLSTYEIKWYDLEERKKEVFELLVNKLKNKLENLID